MHLKFLQFSEKIDDVVKRDFNDDDSFKCAKGNLFNLITINCLLKYAVENPKFDMGRFVKNGTVPKLYEQPIQGIEIDPRYVNDLNRFYKEIIDYIYYKHRRHTCAHCCKSYPII